MKLLTPLGIAETISRENKDGEVLVILRKADNADWKWEGDYIFRLVDVKDCEEMR